MPFALGVSLALLCLSAMATVTALSEQCSARDELKFELSVLKDQRLAAVLSAIADSVADISVSCDIYRGAHGRCRGRQHGRHHSPCR